MNYCIAAFAIILIISAIQWFVDGRKNYKGPKIDDESMLSFDAIAAIDGDKAKQLAENDGTDDKHSKEA